MISSISRSRFSSLSVTSDSTRAALAPGNRVFTRAFRPVTLATDNHLMGLAGFQSCRGMNGQSDPGFQLLILDQTHDRRSRRDDGAFIDVSFGDGAVKRSQSNAVFNVDCQVSQAGVQDVDGGSLRLEAFVPRTGQQLLQLALDGLGPRRGRPNAEGGLIELCL